MGRKKIKFHHVGIAVKNIEKASKVLENLLGVPFSSEEYVKAQEVKVSFADLGANKVELIEATSLQSPIFPILPHTIISYIEKHGPGIHHLGFQVQNMDQTVDDLKRKGIRTLTNEIQEGSEGARVIFLDPRDCQNMLIELYEVKESL